MGPLDEAGKTAAGVIDALKSQPMALALVVVNVLFLLGGGYMAKVVIDRATERSARMDALFEKCLSARISETPHPDKEL